MKTFHMLRSIAFILVFTCAQTAAAHTAIETQLESVTQELENHPNDSSLYLTRGELKRHNRDWLGAEADFAQAYQLGPAEVRSQIDLYRGRLFKDAGQSQRAVDELDSFIGRNPEHIDALRIRALAYVDMGRINEAIADYTRLISLDTARSPELWLERARLLLRNGQTDTAVESIDEASKIFGPLVNLIEFAVDAELSRHNYSAALMQIEKLPPVLQETPEWLWRRGQLFEKLNRPEDAAQLYAQAQDAISKMPLHRQKSAAMQDLLGKLTVPDDY